MFVAQYQAQKLNIWSTEWGGGTGTSKDKHGTGIIVAGCPTVFTLMPGGEYDTFYQLLRGGWQPGAKTIVHHTSYQFPDDNCLAKCQALESEVHANDGQYIFNGGVQFDIKGAKVVRTYDYGLGKWIPTTIPATDALLAGSKVLDAVWVYDLVDASSVKTITWRGLLLNGTWIPLGITRNAVQKAGTPCTNFAWQIDCTATITPNTILIPAIDITIT